MQEASEVPLTEIQSGRPDFDFSTLLLFIGLQQTGHIPHPLLGDDERFLQDKRALEGRRKPIANLLLDEPSGYAVEHNRDLFVKGGRRKALCLPCALLALYSHSQFSGAMGAGYYPGVNFHSAMYLLTAPTVGQMISRNVVDTPISDAVYFSSPNKIWLGDPSDGRECALCAETGPSVTEFHICTSGMPPIDPGCSPHRASTAKGKRYAIGPASSILDVEEGAAVDSRAAIAPLSIAENCAVGDEIISFGTFYEKGSLRRMFYHCFRSRAIVNYAPLRQTTRAIWRMKFPRVDVNHNSTFYAQIWSDLSDRVLAGQSAVEAGVDVFDAYCPHPGRSRRLLEWTMWREKICRS